MSQENDTTVNVPEADYYQMLEEFRQGPKETQSVQVLDGSSRDHDIYEFDGDTPDQIHKVLRYIADNALQNTKPWSIIWNLNQMLLASLGELPEDDEDEEIPIPDFEE